MQKTNGKSPWLDEGQLPDCTAELPESRAKFQEILSAMGKEHLENLTNQLAKEIGPLTRSFDVLAKAADPQDMASFADLRLAFFAGCHAYHDAVYSFALEMRDKSQDHEKAFGQHMEAIRAELQMHWEALQRDTEAAAEQVGK